MASGDHEHQEGDALSIGFRLGEQRGQLLLVTLVDTVDGFAAEGLAAAAALMVVDVHDLSMTL